MLASISPVGEAARGQRWSITTTAYVVASVAGGATTGVALGALGWALAALLAAGGLAPPAGAVALALAVAGLVFLAVDHGRVSLRLPAWRRQVDERWLTDYRGWVYGAGFGFQLGAGVFTRIPSAALYLLALFAVATASPVAGALVGATFGLVRALPLLLTARLHDPSALQAFHRHLDERTPTVRRATDLTVLATVAVLFATTLA